MIEYGLVVVAGLLASFHCVGMCGAIVVAYSTQPLLENAGLQTKSGFLLHTAYNGGRILSYALLGAAAGIAGMAISGIEQIGQYVAVIGGGVMIVAGLALLGILPLPSRFSLTVASGVLTKLHGKFLRERTLRSKLSLGLLTPLLPCGILYAMLAKAAAAGSALNGAITMALFAVGMAPSLMLIGSVSSFFSARTRKGAEQLAAVTIFLMGIILVLRGFHVPYLGWLSGESECSSCIH